MGSVWSRLGSEVTFKYLDFITPGMDERYQMSLKILTKQGIKFKLGQKSIQ